MKINKLRNGITIGMFLVICLIGIGLVAMQVTAVVPVVIAAAVIAAGTALTVWVLSNPGSAGCTIAGDADKAYANNVNVFPKKTTGYYSGSKTCAMSDIGATYKKPNYYVTISADGVISGGDSDKVASTQYVYGYASYGLTSVSGYVNWYDDNTGRYKVRNLD